MDEEEETEEEEEKVEEIGEAVEDGVARVTVESGLPRMGWDAHTAGVPTINGSA